MSHYFAAQSKINPVITKSSLVPCFLSQLKAIEKTTQSIFLHNMDKKYHLLEQFSRPPYGSPDFDDSTAVDSSWDLINKLINDSYK